MVHHKVLHLKKKLRYFALFVEKKAIAILCMLHCTATTRTSYKLVVPTCILYSGRFYFPISAATTNIGLIMRRHSSGGLELVSALPGGRLADYPWYANGTRCDNPVVMAETPEGSFSQERTLSLLTSFVTSDTYHNFVNVKFTSFYYCLFCFQM